MMYNVFDAHCDTAYELYKDAGKGSFRDNIIHFSVAKTLEYNRYIQVIALWADPEYDGEEAFTFMDNMLTHTLSELEQQEISIIKRGSDFDFETGFRAIIGIEGGRAIYNNPDNLYHFYDRGVRCMTLTWNGTNLLGYGNDVCEDKGLTEFGKDIVSRMNKINMIVDVSHLNTQGFYDVMELSEKPVIASHSNSRSLCGHWRNLSDDQFTKLIENGGVTGINLCEDFLNESGRATVDDVVKHIDHFMELGGENNIGLGTDFDGIPTLPWEIQGNGDLYKIFNELSIMGYTKEQIDKISHGNFERIFRSI